MSTNATCTKIARQVSTLPIADVRKNIEQLNFDNIKVKLMHPDEGPGWSREKADAVEKLYRRFLFLATTTPEVIVPTVDVDRFWHQHILDTRQYSEDCEQAFGFFLHHCPYFGLRGEKDRREFRQAFERTKALYESVFGEPLGNDYGETVRVAEKKTVLEWHRAQAANCG